MKNLRTRFSSLARIAIFASAPLAGNAAAQYSFDYVTFDHVEVQPDPAHQSFSPQWGLIVNTGAVAIPLAEVGAGLNFATVDQPLGSFGYNLNHPGGVSELQPGEAIGNTHPKLLAELLPGETLAFPGSVSTASLHLGKPYPAGSFEVDLYAQVGDRVAHTTTLFEYDESLGDTEIRVESATRVSAVPAPTERVFYGGACAVDGIDPYLLLDGAGAAGSTIAFNSNMPQLGNAGLTVLINGFNGASHAPYLFFIDFAPGALPISGCELLVGLAPGFLVEAGTLIFPVGAGFVPVPIPDNPALAGADVYFQALIVSDDTANGLFGSTQGMRIRLGDVTP